MRSPLAVPAQLDIERRAVALLGHPLVREARETTLAWVLRDPMAADAEGKARGTRAVDCWLGKVAFDAIARGAEKAEILWNNQTAPYHWFGHEAPLSGAAGDNPDFLYRGMNLDGSAEYEIHVSVAEPAATIAFQLTDDPTLRCGFAVRDEGIYDIQSRGELSDQHIVRGDDGAFSVTLGPSPAAGRANHIQTPPHRLHLIVRSILNEWTQVPHALRVVRLDGRSESQTYDDEAAVRLVAESLDAYVKFWMDYRFQMAGNPAPNVLIEPYLRNGGWSTMAFVKPRLADDEAMIFSLPDTGEIYRGIQYTDRFMMSPDPLLVACSYNRAQSIADDDGQHTYILTREDPGIGNWIDPAGTVDGWILLRWAGLSPDPGKLISNHAIVKTAALAGQLGRCPTVTPDERRSQLAERSRQWQLRIAEG